MYKEAYEVLSDATLKSQYDATQRRKAATAAPSSSYARQQQTRSVYSYYADFEDDLHFVDLDEEDEDFGFISWLERNGKSSSQSSWSANKKKQKAKAAAGSQRQKRPTADAGLEELLDNLDPETLRALRNVFGSRLEHLESMEVRLCNSPPLSSLPVLQP